MHRYFCFILLFATSLALSATVDYFSDAPRTFKPLLADPREAQLRIGYLYSGENKSYLDMGFGGQLNITNFIFENGHLVTIALKGLAASRFQYGSKSFDLQNSDFTGGLSTVFGRNTSFVELYLSHQSSHFGDDIIFQNSSLFKNYSFESTRLLYSREFSFPLRVYAGPRIIFRSDPEELKMKMQVLAGGEYFPIYLSDFYFAALFSSKQENAWAIDSSWIAGYYLGDAEKVVRRQRIFLEIYNGFSPQGQLSNKREFSIFAGFGFTL